MTSLNTETLFSKSLTTTNIALDFNNVGKNIKKTLEDYLKYNFEGKCLDQGYIKPDSCQIVNYSCGTIFDGKKVLFNVVYECLACHPVEGMYIECIVKNITKAGLKCESKNYVPSPLLIHLAKEHNRKNKHFSKIKIGDTITARIISARFELNDIYVSVTAELV